MAGGEGSKSSKIRSFTGEEPTDGMAAASRGQVSQSGVATSVQRAGTQPGNSEWEVLSLSEARSPGGASSASPMRPQERVPPLPPGSAPPGAGAKLAGAPAGGAVDGSVFEASYFYPSAQMLPPAAAQASPTPSPPGSSYLALRSVSTGPPEGEAPMVVTWQRGSGPEEESLLDPTSPLAPPSPVGLPLGRGAGEEEEEGVDHIQPRRAEVEGLPPSGTALASAEGGGVLGLSSYLGESLGEDAWRVTPGGSAFQIPGNGRLSGPSPGGRAPRREEGDDGLRGVASAGADAGAATGGALRAPPLRPEAGAGQAGGGESIGPSVATAQLSPPHGASYADVDGGAGGTVGMSRRAGIVSEEEEMGTGVEDMDLLSGPLSEGQGISVASGSDNESTDFSGGESGQQRSPFAARLPPGAPALIVTRAGTAPAGIPRGSSGRAGRAASVAGRRARGDRWWGLLAGVPLGSSARGGGGGSGPSFQRWPADGWWDHRAALRRLREAVTAQASTLWSVALSAAVAGILLVAHRWQRERRQHYLLRTQLTSKDEVIGQLSKQISHLNEALEGRRRIPVLLRAPVSRSGTTLYGGY